MTDPITDVTLRGIIHTESRGAALTALGMANTWIGGVDMSQRTCSVDGCERPHRARGWCNAHWIRWRKSGTADPSLPVRTPSAVACSGPGCKNPPHARDLCSTHYWRLRKGLPFERPVRTPAGPEERFWRFVSKSSNGCWSWSGCVTTRGYGQFRGRARKTIIAHRYAYTLLVGPIPQGLHLDHLCRNTRCVNPSHLEPVTAAENNRRAWAAGAYSPKRRVVA